CDVTAAFGHMRRVGGDQVRACRPQRRLLCGDRRGCERAGAGEAAGADVLRPLLAAPPAPLELVDRVAIPAGLRHGSSCRAPLTAPRTRSAARGMRTSAR